jgi:dinuclear metal center YbgI/SA1388 family protein
MTGVPLSRLREYLDAYLRVAEVPDDPNAVNGLEVENSGTVTSIGAAVDASQATIDGVATPGALILVHHGLFWDGTHAAVGRRYRRLKRLLDRDLALYGAHIPLDVHPEVGNNAVLARDLGLANTFGFDNYKGIPLGVAGELTRPRDEIVTWLERRLRTSVRLIPGGPAETRRIGVVTGAAGSHVRAAKDAGCDTFISGEGPHHAYFDAMEFGVNLILAGHYATEQVGVQALAQHLSERFGLPWEFHDHPTGM